MNSSHVFFLFGFQLAIPTNGNGNWDWEMQYQVPFKIQKGRRFTSMLPVTMIIPGIDAYADERARDIRLLLLKRPTAHSFLLPGVPTQEIKNGMWGYSALTMTFFCRQLGFEILQTHSNTKYGHMSSWFFFHFRKNSNSF